MTTEVELKGQWASYWGHPKEVVNPGQTKDIRVDNEQMLVVSCNKDDSGGRVLVQDFSLEIGRAGLGAGHGLRVPYNDTDVPFGTASVGIQGGCALDVRVGWKQMAIVTHVPAKPDGRR